jgi:hypothetical protein
VILYTDDTDFVDMLIASGWFRGEQPDTFYWPTKKMPRC